MSYRYTTTVNFPQGDDLDQDGPEFEVEVSYTVHWGTPETGAGYMADPARYDPGSPSIVEDFKLVKVDGKERPWNMGYGHISDEDFEAMVDHKIRDDDLIQNAREIEDSRRPD